MKFGFVPLRKLRKNSRSQMPRKFKNLRKCKKLLWQHRNDDLLGPLNFRILHRKCCEELRRIAVTTTCRYERNQVSAGNKNSFYKFMKNKLKSNQGIPVLRRSDGTFVSEDFEKCQILNNFFSSVFVLDDGVLPVFPMRVPENVCLTDCHFSPHEVCRELRNLPNKKSGTPEDLPAFFLKNIAKACFASGEHWLSCSMLPSV